MFQLITKLEASNACLEQQVESLKADLMEATDLQHSASMVKVTARSSVADSTAEVLYDEGDESASTEDSVTTVRRNVKVSVGDITESSSLEERSEERSRRSSEKRPRSRSNSLNRCFVKKSSHGSQLKADMVLGGKAADHSPSKRTKVSVRVKVKSVNDQDETIDSTMMTDESMLIGNARTLCLDLPAEKPKKMAAQETQTSFLAEPISPCTRSVLCAVLPSCECLLINGECLLFVGRRRMGQWMWSN